MSDSYVYVPVEDGEYLMPNEVMLSVSHGGTELEQWNTRPHNLYKDGTPKDIDEVTCGDMRLCRREPVVWLDAPTRVGRWAFKGDILSWPTDVNDGEIYYTVTGYGLEIVVDLALWGEGLCFSYYDTANQEFVDVDTKECFGKWLKLNIAWPNGEAGK